MPAPCLAVVGTGVMPVLGLLLFVLFKNIAPIVADVAPVYNATDRPPSLS